MSVIEVEKEERITIKLVIETKIGIPFGVGLFFIDQFSSVY